jgi:hypothetical protein
VSSHAGSIPVTRKFNLIVRWCLVHQPLSFGCLDGSDSALAVVQLPVVVAEFVLGKVAVQVLLANAVIDAVKAALEDRKEAFNAVRGDICAFRRWRTVQPAMADSVGA